MYKSSTERGTSYWIWSYAGPSQQPEYVLFRRMVSYDTVPESVILNITADTHYLLKINGQLVCRGPAKSQRYRYYDTVDIAPFLKQGENVLIAEVCHYVCDPFKANRFEAGPISMPTKPQGGLLIFGDTDWETNDRYECHEMKARRFVPAPEEYMYLAFNDELDARLLPTGLDGSPSPDWHPVEQLEANVGYYLGGLATVWNLHPRTIPHPFERSRPFAGVTRAAVAFSNAAQLLTADGVTLSAGTDTWVELDAGANITAFPVLETDGGSGSRVELLYAEGYGTVKDGVFVKRDRADHQTPGQELVGLTDVYIVGNDPYRYQPFNYKAFRFLRLHIQVGETPLHIRMADLVRTGYPLPVTTSFTHMSDEDRTIWDVSFRTAQNCMYDTFMDCPHYERMQYVMDTCLQMQFSGAISNDDRLIRKAIIDIGDQQLPDGLFPCNVPSNVQQIIPAFSLYFVFMLKQYYYRFGKTDLLKRYFAAMEQTLWFFEQHLNDQQLVCNTGYWQFIDWAKEWEKGVPIRYAEEPNGILTMMLVYALREAADLCRALGYRDVAARHIRLADSISESINEVLFDSEIGLYNDTTTRNDKSQHAQVWAVLAGIAQGERAWKVMNRCLEKTDLTQVSFCMEYYLLRALEKVGNYCRSRDRWGLWRNLLAQNVTTWPEDPVTCRSECHAWSAIPLYEYTACGLGLTPAAPGFAKLRVSPKMFWLKQFGGRIETPAGWVTIDWKVDEQVLSVSLETEHPMTVVWDLPGFSGEELVEGAVQRQLPFTELIHQAS